MIEIKAKTAGDGVELSIGMEGVGHDIAVEAATLITKLLENIGNEDAVLYTTVLAMLAVVAKEKEEQLDIGMAAKGVS